MCKFCTCDIFFQFFLFINVSYVTANNSSVFIEQICHLLLSQPNCLFTHSHLQPDGLIGLIHDDFAFC